MKRVVFSGLIAGVVFFVWLSILHLATPLGQVGIRAIPNEDAVAGSIKTNIANPGFYFFPGAIAGPNASKAEKRAAMARAMEKMKTSPTGIMVVFPNGRAPLAPKQLLTELLNDIAQGLLLAWLLSRSTTHMVSDKVKFALAIGVAASLVTNLSYWNWYGFPTDYTLAYMFGEITGYGVMGFAIAVVTMRNSLPGTSEMSAASGD